MIVVRCKSRFSGTSSICKKDGEIIEFPNKEKAEEYAKECRKLMGLGYHYWVSEE